jgi:hypothetical protein
MYRLRTSSVCCASGPVYVTPPGDSNAAARFLFIRHVLNELTLDGSPVVLVPVAHLAREMEFTVLKVTYK